MSMRMFIGALIAAVVGGFLLLEPACAHAGYLRSEPGDGAVVARPPQRVDIWFTQELFRRQGENRIQVFNEAGQAVQVGDAQVDDDDRKHLWVTLPDDLQPGKYRVAWRSLSAEDGDSAEGEFSFSLDPGAAVTSTPMGADAPGATPPAVQDTPAAASETALPTPAPSGPQPGPTSRTCLPGLLPLAGLVAITMIHKQRRGSLQLRTPPDRAQPLAGCRVSASRIPAMRSLPAGASGKRRPRP